MLQLATGCLLFGGMASRARPDDVSAPIFLGVTTSTENSGLLAYLLEDFAKDRGIPVRAVTAGSGAVLNLAARGDVDLVLVHSPEDEMTFIEAGFGIDRRPVMQNRFVIVGPSDDPAGVGGASTASNAFAAIAEQEALFLSRGDESGTHRAELRLWTEIGVDPTGVGSDGGTPSWYRESGSGQGATLNIAANTKAYTLTDEATWVTFGNPGELRALFTKDDPALRNLYSVIRVNPDRHAALNVEGALILADWLTSKAGQESISSFQVKGRTLFEAADHLAG